MAFPKPAAGLATAFALLLRATGAQADEAAPATATATEHAPAFAAAPTAAPPPGVPHGPTVFVHIDAERGVELEGWVDVDPHWTWSFSCRAPCDAALPWAARYKLSDADRHLSSEFALDAASGQHLVIAVVPASHDAMSGGVALIVLGSGAALTGLVLLGVAFLGSLGGCEDTEPIQCPGVGTYVAGGLASFVAGGGVLVTGILLRHFGGRLGQKQTVSDLLPKLPERLDTAWLRAPVWRDSQRDGATGAARVGIPIFSHSF